jgi:hypothetical protein
MTVFLTALLMQMARPKPQERIDCLQFAQLLPTDWQTKHCDSECWALDASNLTMLWYSLVSINISYNFRVLKRFARNNGRFATWLSAYRLCRLEVINLIFTMSKPRFIKPFAGVPWGEHYIRPLWISLIWDRTRNSWRVMAEYFANSLDIIFVPPPIFVN